MHGQGKRSSTRAGAGKFRSLTKPCEVGVLDSMQVLRCIHFTASTRGPGASHTALDLITRVHQSDLSTDLVKSRNLENRSVVLKFAIGRARAYSPYFKSALLCHDPVVRVMIPSCYAMYCAALVHLIIGLAQLPRQRLFALHYIIIVHWRVILIVPAAADVPVGR